MSVEDLLARWTASGYAPSVGKRLLEDYGASRRRFHSSEHLRQMFALMDSAGVGLDPSDRQALELAIWYHNCVYHPGRRDNELLSAVRLLADSEGLGLPPDLRQRGTDLILLSRHHHPPPGDTAAELFCDLDLAVLGSPPKEYEKYARAIRDDYSSFSSGRYAWGRRRVLADLLARSRLFHHLLHLEEPARQNVRTESLQFHVGTLAGPLAAILLLAAMILATLWAGRMGGLRP